MNRLVFLTVWLLLFAGFQSPTNAQARKKILVCSTTQVADFARQIVGDRWEVKCVLGAGDDPHLYSVKTSDAALVASADLCAENGWHLEGKEWMKQLAKDAEKRLVTCADGLEPLELEENDETVDDPHAWFRVPNAAHYVRQLLKEIVKADPDHANEYRARAELYLSELQVLHAWIIKQVSAIPSEKRILVTSHDAFNYFCKTYGFKAAAPVGWSTEEIGGGLTAEKRQVVIDSIRKFGVPAIFVETSVNPKLIQQIAKDAGVRVGGTLYSDAMGEEGTLGETYIGMMRENVLTIVEALK